MKKKIRVLLRELLAEPADQSAQPADQSVRVVGVPVSEYAFEQLRDRVRFIQNIEIRALRDLLDEHERVLRSHRIGVTSADDDDSPPPSPD